MELDASFWALAGLVLFFALLIYLKVPGMIAGALDDRAAKISDELDEARRLREEAQELLAEYQRRRKEAETEAEAIISAATREADALAKEAVAKTEEFVARRTALAEQKIAQAEAEAMAEVKASAVDLAIAASEQLISEKLTGNAASAMVKKSIAEVKDRLN